MDKLTLLDTLKSKSMTLSLEEIQGIMDEELSKSSEEMDVELIDLCADVLDKAYFDNSEGSTAPEVEDELINENAKPRRKRIKLNKILLAAAIIIISFSIALTTNAKYIQSDASAKIVKYVDNHFETDLMKGKHKAIKHSDENNYLVKKLKEGGFGDIILPSALLGDDYSKGDINFSITEDENILWSDIHFESKTNKVYGSIGITEYKSDTVKFIMGQGNLSEGFDSVKQLRINGMDVLIFTDDDSAFIQYIDRDIEYDIDIQNSDLDLCVEIMKTLE